ncbi:proteophosphoglycan 5 [Moniliophthora roreri]|nr:proteophosphoglycan 5 [Moniliophthora roreri]
MNLCQSSRYEASEQYRMHFLCHNLCKECPLGSAFWNSDAIQIAVTVSLQKKSGGCALSLTICKSLADRKCSLHSAQ